MEGMQALFPIYLSRLRGTETEDAYNSMVAQNENNLNQNFYLISQKLMELETALNTSKECRCSGRDEGGTEG